MSNHQKPLSLSNPGTASGFFDGKLALALLEKAALPILLFEPKGVIHYANQAAGALLGLSPTQLIGIGIPALQPLPDFKDWLRQGTPRQIEGSLKSSSGDSVPVEIQLESLMAEGRELVSCSIRDLREERNLQAQLAQSQKLEAIGRLAGGIAHDFNNLLTVILGYTDLMMENIEHGDPNRSSAREVQEAAQKGANLIRQILIFSRKQNIEPRNVDLNSFVGRLKPMLRQLIGEDVILRDDLSSPPLTVFVDPAQLDQVLINLCVNARDAMPQGGELAINTRRRTLDRDYAAGKSGVVPGEYACLSVTDSGVGMDKATLDRLFEPFFSTKPRDRGTGLGMSTAYGIVKRAGGNIWAYSEPGRGTTIKVYLPLIEHSLEEQPASDVPTELRKGTEKLLIVEDSDPVRFLLGRHLRDLGYTVLLASSPSTALEIAEENRDIDLFLIDLILPELDGELLEERLRRLVPQARTIFMSGYSSRGIPGGPKELKRPFLEKPIMREQLARTVRDCLDS